MRVDTRICHKHFCSNFAGSIGPAGLLSLHMPPNSRTYLINLQNSQMNIEHKHLGKCRVRFFVLVYKHLGVSHLIQDPGSIPIMGFTVVGWLRCQAPKREFASSSLRCLPISGLPWSLFKCGGPSMVLLQLKDQGPPIHQAYVYTYFGYLFASK